MLALNFKWLSVVILLFTAAGFMFDWMPPHFEATDVDDLGWILTLLGLAFSQTMLLLASRIGCLGCRVWGDFTLQLTGFVFILLSGAFGAVYPPYSWAMGVFPIVGVLCLAAGRDFGKWTRRKIEGDV